MAQTAQQIRVLTPYVTHAVQHGSFIKNADAETSIYFKVAMVTVWRSAHQSLHQSLRQFPHQFPHQFPRQSARLPLAPLDILATDHAVAADLV